MGHNQKTNEQGNHLNEKENSHLEKTEHIDKMDEHHKGNDENEIEEEHANINEMKAK